jgi:hypothetical protein
VAPVKEDRKKKRELDAVSGLGCALGCRCAWAEECGQYHVISGKDTWLDVGRCVHSVSLLWAGSVLLIVVCLFCALAVRTANQQLGVYDKTASSQARAPTTPKLPSSPVQARGSLRREAVSLAPPSEASTTGGISAAPELEPAIISMFPPAQHIGYDMFPSAPRDIPEQQRHHWHTGTPKKKAGEPVENREEVLSQELDDEVPLEFEPPPSPTCTMSSADLDKGQPSS